MYVIWVGSMALAYRIFFMISGKSYALPSDVVNVLALFFCYNWKPETPNCYNIALFEFLKKRKHQYISVFMATKFSLVPFNVV
jgi:hypothetical protein